MQKHRHKQTGPHLSRGMVAKNRATLSGVCEKALNAEKVGYGGRSKKKDKQYVKAKRRNKDLMRNNRECRVG